MIDVARLSFSNATLLRNPSKYGLMQYTSLFSSSDFGQMIVVTLKYVAGSLFFQVLFGLLIAVLVHEGKKRKVPGAVLTRSVVLSCWIIPAPAIGIIWKIILSEFDYGIANHLIGSFFDQHLAFLSNERLAIFSVIVANIWCGTAFSMLILYSGLQQIPESLYEAAVVDGATEFQKFRYLTLPLLRPFLFTDLSLATIYTFNSFGLIMSLTAGGPGRSTEVLAMSVYRTIFDRMNLGRGAALSMVLLVVNLVIAIVYNKSFFKKTQA
jgi:multiple sugar transport system permease protein